MSDSQRPIFLDPSGRRWRAVRGAALAVGVISSVLAIAMLLLAVIPPLMPDTSAEAFRTSAGKAIKPTARQAKQHAAARRRLMASLRQTTRRPAFRGTRVDSTRTTVDPLVVGFYVNWDDNSFQSLTAHAAELDWVVAEWGFLDAATGPKWKIDAKVPKLIAKLPERDRPALLALVTNVADQGKRFDPMVVRKLLATPKERARMVDQMARAVDSLDLAGLVLDFEGLEPEDEMMLEAFTRELRARLVTHGLVVARTVATNLPPALLTRISQSCDYVIVMVYDEHYGKGDPGPVASQQWFTDESRRALAAMPPAKTIIAVGTYGYDWNDAGPASSGGALTFGEVMRQVRRNNGKVTYDRESMNPYATWTDADSTDHIAWFLGATTSWNQARTAARLGAAGVAMWRLGAEEPTVWRVLGRRGADATADALSIIDPPYDVEIDGKGELLDIAARPTEGRRRVEVDTSSGLIIGAEVEALPSPWVVRKTGAAHPDRVALTFDDGPDGQWTGAILDTLKAHNAVATFFVVGAHAVRHPRLMRRIADEGHEFGNHTYTHPNLAIVPNIVTRFEIQFTERALEAITGRRSAFFRPPYFGDAEPTTLDELEPALLATNLGYLIAGLHVESNDWQRPGVAKIVETALKNRDRGQVVLLHDGGGERSQTVAALGPLIDSLRERGDTIVTLSKLLDRPPVDAMAPLPPSGEIARNFSLAAFAAVGGLQLAIAWVFGAAVVLGTARLAIIMALALRQRFRRRPDVRDPSPWPAVSVIVPAYNEKNVIVATVRSLLSQEYAGHLDVVVVDDGSPDGTGALAEVEFANEPRVTVIRQENGGKAKALNTGIARATSEVVVCLDADTQFLPTTVAALMRPFADPKVGAVAGNAKVGNRINLVTWWQALEYVTSQNVDRRAFDLLNCITVVPGAVGAWRRDAVLAAGGFTDQTLAEDQDLTIALRRRDWRVAYAPDAIAYTEAPDTLGGLAKQRFRWSFGTLQCAWKHRDTAFRSKYGTLGWVAMPNTWIFQLAFTALSPLADLLFVFSILAVALTWVQHGRTYALVDAERLLLYYVAFVAVDWIAAVVAFELERGEDQRLTWLIALQRFAYRQIMYWVVVRSIVAALRGRVVGWGTLERKGTVALPPA